MDISAFRQMVEKNPKGFWAAMAWEIKFYRKAATPKRPSNILLSPLNSIRRTWRPISPLDGRWSRWARRTPPNPCCKPASMPPSPADPTAGSISSRNYSSCYAHLDKSFRRTYES